MGAPPSLLGRCDACVFYDVVVAGATGTGWCRVSAPVRLVAHQPHPTGQLSQTDTRRGQWPLVGAAEWCGLWGSPTPLPTTIAVAPASVPRMTGTVTISVYNGGTGVFVSGDVVRFNNVGQTTTFVSTSQLTFPLDTAQAAGDYPVRVVRPSTGRLSDVAVLKLT